GDDMASHWMIPSMIGACAVLALGGTSGLMQQPNAATLVHVEGVVTLDDAVVSPSANPVVLGDTGRIRTADGRAVVSLKHGGILTVDGHALVRVVGNGPGNFDEIEILQGSAIVISELATQAVICRTTSFATEALDGFDRWSRERATVVAR